MSTVDPATEERIKQLVDVGHANAIAEVNRLRDETVAEVVKSKEINDMLNASFTNITEKLTRTDAEQKRLIDHVNQKKIESDACEEKLLGISFQIDTKIETVRAAQSAADHFITTQTHSMLNKVIEIKKTIWKNASRTCHNIQQIP